MNEQKHERKLVGAYLDNPLTKCDYCIEKDLKHGINLIYLSGFFFGYYILVYSQAVMSYLNDFLCSFSII